MTYALDVQTVQASAFRILVEALKEILTDANFEFDSTGMKIVAMDSSHTVLVHLRLNSENFESYECNKNKLILGINLINFYKLMKIMGNNDTLSLRVDEDDLSSLHIIIENSEKNTVTRFKLNLMDLHEENIEVPPPSFESVITMPSIDFQKICRDMHNLADDIEIKSVGSQLIFGCKGQFAEQETAIGSSTNGLSFIQNTEDDKIVQGNYALKHLVLFSKCTNLCNSVELYLKNDFPLIIKYTVASLGEIKLCLAPKYENN
jgi:proliferating cell nuclear antigen